MRTYAIWSMPRGTRQYAPNKIIYYRGHARLLLIINLEVYMATAKRKASLDRRRSFGERFDLNTVSLTGPVIAVWGRNGDVFVRIQSPNAACVCLVHKVM